MFSHFFGKQWIDMIKYETINPHRFTRLFEREVWFFESEVESKYQTHLNKALSFDEALC